MFSLLKKKRRENSRLFSQLHYFYVKREGNKVIHFLARHAINVLDLAIWMEDIPSQFVFVLQVDFAGFS